MAAAAQPTQAPHQPDQQPRRGPCATAPQQHTWPFLNVPPQQPCLPFQWGVLYNNLYCGFPAMSKCTGYAMVGMVPRRPAPPPYPFVDGPSYVMPYTPFHLVDYRQIINPHMRPMMPYQARRFPYLEGTNPRDMISSEVQTELDGFSMGVPKSPLTSESGRDTCCSASNSTNTSSASSTEIGNHECSEPVVVAASQQPTSSTFVGALTPKTTVFQDDILSRAEEVQNKCGGTIAGLQIDLHFGEEQHLKSESRMPYVPNRERLIQNGLPTPCRDALSPVVEEPMTPDVSEDYEDSVFAEENDPHGSRTSLKPLLAHLPSASCLGDFDNVSLYHKVEPNVQEQLCSHVKNVEGGPHMSQSLEMLPSGLVQERGRFRQRLGTTSDVFDHTHSHEVQFPGYTHYHCVDQSATKCGEGARILKRRLGAAIDVDEQELLHIGCPSRKRPVAQWPKLREQNCSCDIPTCPQRTGNQCGRHGQQNDRGWERGIPIGYNSEEARDPVKRHSHWLQF